MSGLMRLAVLVAVGALAQVGCGPSTWHLTAGQQTTAAQGQVTAKAGPNNNTQLEVRVKHLASPQKVMPGATVYVVWVRGTNESDRPQNVGALRLDSDLQGSLDTTTPLRSFDLLITAESGPTVVEPVSGTVLIGRISRR